jgi:DNA-binding transcriptional regulator YdaS (Cro superfamily)
MRLNDYLQAERGRLARVAAAIGMSPAYLSDIAKGRRPCPAKHAPAIERACAFQVRRQELCRDWRKAWPELIGAEGAASNRRARGSGRRAEDMRSIRVDGIGRPPAIAAPAPSPEADRGEPLKADVLRCAAQAAEAACRSKDMTPAEAAIAVVDAYLAARAKLDLDESAHPGD